MSQRKKQDGEPTWVKHPVHGWLPDECPLFEDPRYARGGMWGNYALNELYAFDGNYAPLDANIVSLGLMGSWPDGNIVPLTTAARDLLAALKAEVP
jgi:hypothetical protein